MEGEEGRNVEQDTRGDVAVVSPSSSEYCTIKGKGLILILVDLSKIN